jgi:hypothetical protein
MLFLFLSHETVNKKPRVYLYRQLKISQCQPIFFKVCDMRKGENMPIFCQLIRQTFPGGQRLEHRVHRVATAHRCFLAYIQS